MNDLHEPASFIHPPVSYDLTDIDLPRHCDRCGGWLPLSNKWEVEQDEGKLVTYYQCVKCGTMNVLTLANWCR